MELGCSWDCLGIMDMGQGPRPGWYCCCACLFWFLFFSVCAACGIKTCGKTGFEERAWRRPPVILNRHDKFSSSTLTGFRSWCLYYTSIKIAIYRKASHHKYTPHIEDYTSSGVMKIDKIPKPAICYQNYTPSSVYLHTTPFLKSPRPVDIRH